jgi:4-amino-4-deoxy-L-arabinose transferase-like glycosyltransferase
MGLYYLLLRAWVHLGDGETTVRLLSCIFGTVTVAALYIAGARLFDRTTGLVAALLLAVDAGHLWVSQEARSYALVMCLTTISWWFLLRAATAARGRETWIAWAAYVVTAALAVYAHFYAALVLLAQAGVALWIPIGTATSDSITGGRIPRRVVLAGTLALVALLWPLARFLIAHPHHNIDWIGSEHQNRLQGVLWPVMHPTSSWGLASVAMLVVVGPGAIVAAWRRLTITTRWRCGVVLMWLGVPIVIAVATSLLLTPVIDQRYLTVCLPPLALATAVALTHVWPPRWFGGALLTVLAVDSVSVHWYYTHAVNEDWRGATAYVIGQAAPGDRVLFYAPYVHIPFDLYRDRLGVVRDASPQGPRHGQSLAVATAEARAQAPRVWLVLSHVDSPACQRAVARDLGSRFASGTRRAFTQIEVDLFSAPSDSSSGQAPAADSISVNCPQR